MSRIEKRFRELQKNKQKAFIAYITAGYPNLAVTEKLVLEFSKIGVDIVELGVPFSDPMADGPLIQEASRVALRNKVNLGAILRLVKKIRRYTQIPICLMTYYNPIFAFGENRFAKNSAVCGVDAVIVPDLPPEEGESFGQLAKRHKLDVISFVSPTTSGQRIKFIASPAKGFIYYVSLTGVTGPRQHLPSSIRQNIKKIKRFTRVPVCVGFGVSNHQQVLQIYALADGVIVGSAIIKNIKKNLYHADLIKKVSGFVRRLKGKTNV